MFEILLDEKYANEYRPHPVLKNHSDVTVFSLVIVQ